MLPYYLPFFEQPSLPIPLPLVGTVTIHAFGVLVALALIVGTWVARWHGTQRGLDPIHIVDGTTWTCIAGFVVAHIVSVVFYFPERLIAEPAQIFYIWNGLSSFGGFIGAAFGAYFYFKRKGLPILPYIDALLVGLCPGWILGRMGCTVAHDHPGLETDFFLAFDHPTRGPIHDLGFYEFLFAICVTVIVMIVRRYKWPVGAMPAMVCFLYAPVRFSFDFLRVSDAKYDGLTPGQWMSVGMLVGGYLLWRYAWGKLHWLELMVPGVIAIGYGVFRFISGFSGDTAPSTGLFSGGQWLALIMIGFGGWLVYRAIVSKSRPRKEAGDVTGSRAETPAESERDRILSRRRTGKGGSRRRERPPRERDEKSSDDQSPDRED